MRARAEEIISTRRVIVCCGAGGVGKTSSSAAIAVAAARRGRRVLALTIDPSKRLAQILGVSRNSPEPITLSEEAHKAAGVTHPGSLSAWMLDPQQVADNVVRNMSKSADDATRLLENPIYRNVTSMVAGMQEYTAVEALHRFIHEDRYDLVVLDTPPSRNALQFLDAPARAGRFLDTRIFHLFMPNQSTSRLRRAATKVIDGILDKVLGPRTRVELQEFFVMFSEVLTQLNHNAAEIETFFARDDISFLAVTSPQQEALREAFYFESETGASLGIKLEGYVLSRSLAYRDDHMIAPEFHLTDDSTDIEIAALLKLAHLAEAERALGRQHRMLQLSLARRHGQKGLAIALPYLIEGVVDMYSLVRLSEALTDARSYPSPEE